jgi:hypothetical protein
MPSDLATLFARPVRRFTAGLILSYSVRYGRKDKSTAALSTTAGRECAFHEAGRDDIRIVLGAVQCTRWKVYVCDCTLKSGALPLTSIRARGHSAPQIAQALICREYHLSWTGR